MPALQAQPAQAGVAPQGTIQRVAASPVVVAAANPWPGSRSNVVQRVLQIGPAYFDKSADAAKYLGDEYQKTLSSPRPLTLDEHQRLQEIAGVADHPRYVYPIGTLKEATDYIASGKRLDVQRYDLLPNQTPERLTDDAAPWHFTLYKSHLPPTKMVVPQSPTHQSFFPSSSSSTPAYIDLSSGIKEVSDEIVKWTGSSTKSHIGKNQYAYKLRIQYRVDELEEFKDQKAEVSYARKLPSVLVSETEPSPFYTSKKNMAPQSKGEKPVSVETEMRDELTHLHVNFDRDEFQQTSLFATEKGVRTKTAAHYHIAKVGQLSSLYFHSEVQAASDKKGVRRLVARAVNKLIHKALLGTGKRALVVVAVVITGYSHSRTVCGNACKPALAHLSSVIAEELTNQLHARRNDLSVKAAGLNIRRSRAFTVSTHVGAHVEFQGLETGAQLGVGTPTVLLHNQVFEYKPF